MYECFEGFPLTVIVRPYFLVGVALGEYIQIPIMIQFPANLQMLLLLLAFETISVAILWRK